MEPMLEIDDSCDIAIIGMAGRFPRAKDIAEFWENLRAGVEGISFFSDEELEVQNLTPEELSNPAMVKAGAVLDDIDLFDAAFFDMPAREAEWMDPQQRLFLECAWNAMENAGYNAAAYKGLIAVYAGVGVNTYIMSRLPSISDARELFQIVIANDKDHFATRVSYKLNLRGESITVQTACSTSLVATHLACQSLLSGQCDMAMAGGATIRVPQKTGYLYQEGMILSPDGHCRAFDHKAAGTVDGSGVGVVVLKRLSDALKDGDSIDAVIKGSAINNDGHLKIGYTAPSIEGQADVIAKALAISGVEAESISYIEGHGTGTQLGDPIEIEALTRVFRRNTSRTGFCAIGSVKTNIGHLDTAAGVAGLIKATLALKHNEIPPTLHFEKPNPAIDLQNSPFFVNNTLFAWKSAPAPHRAAVSSFGIGGTNVHLILEEAPVRSPSGDSRAAQLITLSARSSAALERMAESLADHLKAHPEINLPDAAYTQNAGRGSFTKRKFIVASNREHAIEALRATPASGANAKGLSTRKVVFMFPGQGAQSANMGKELYETELFFRKQVDACAELVREMAGVDLLRLIYPASAEIEQARLLLAQPECTLPALFAIEYAMARLWMSWGIHPQAMIGHSFGEYVAACLAGVFSLEDGLNLSLARGRLMQRLPEGAMVAVRLAESDARELLTSDLSIAAVNCKDNCTISGPVAAVEELMRALDERRIGHRRLGVPRAYHSTMIDAILPEFRQVVAKLSLKAPSVPCISGLTGEWIKADEAMSADYWTNQMRREVRFASGLDALLGSKHAIFVEVGPGQGLSALSRQHFGRRHDAVVVPSLTRSQDAQSDTITLLRAVGRVWSTGVEVDWQEFYRDEKRHRVHLPSYSFDRQSYWIETRFERPVAGEQSLVKAAAVDLTASPEQARPGHSVDRSALQSSYERPRNEIEQELADIWGEVLGLQGIGIRDRFYDLGGDSLLATQVHARAEQAISSEITVRDVLSHETIADLCEAIQLQIGDERRLRHPIRPVGRDIELPVSFAQQRMWFIDQTDPGSPLYNLSSAVRLTGSLDPGALKRSFDEIIRRHESLRTTFTTVDGRAVQVVAPSRGLELGMVDLSEVPQLEREAEASKLAVDEARLSFDLSRGPLIRVKLLRLGEPDHVLIITAHHITSDGWSIGVLIRELAAIYNAFSQGKPSPLAELQIQYADFAYNQRQSLEGQAMQGQLAYWRSRLSGNLPVLELPFARPRPEVQSFRGARRSFAVSAELTASLKELSRLEGATLFMTLLAALKTLFHRYTGLNDIVIGSPVAGRQQPEVEDLIGVFINMLVLRSDLGGNPKFRELLGRVREMTLEAYANQDLPFEKLVDELQPQRSLSHSPLFQVLFNFQNTPMTQVEVSGLTMTPMAIDNQTARFDLIINLIESPEGLNGEIEYSDLFEPAAIDRLIGHYEVLLREIVVRPDTRLSALEIITEAERHEQNRQEEERKASERRLLKSVRRKAVTLSREGLIKTTYPDAGQTLPLVFSPNVEGFDLHGWARNNPEFIETHLLTHGAILFRGFQLQSVSEFRDLAASLSPELLDYLYRSTPRTEIGDKIYTSSEYPADQHIPLHNENSYSHNWPMKILFYCAQAAREGGETPIADSRQIYKLIPSEIREQFMRKKIMYVRNYGAGLDLPWQEVFQTSDKSQAEAYCRQAGVDFEWKDADKLRTRQVCQAVASHPRTGETVWFNQAHLFHVSSLDPKVRRSLLDILGEDELPRNACYGDGTPIEDSLLDEIRSAYRLAAVTFRWIDGDVLVLDNMLAAHGRKPYVGPRKIMVAMGGAYSHNGDGSAMD